MKQKGFFDENNRLAELSKKDRLSFQRFLGLSLSDAVPDESDLKVRNDMGLQK